jgi:hypothetical protein
VGKQDKGSALGTLVIDYHVLAIALGFHFYEAGGAEGGFCFGRHKKLAEF